MSSLALPLAIPVPKCPTRVYAGPRCWISEMEILTELRHKLGTPWPTYNLNKESFQVSDFKNYLLKNLALLGTKL